MMRDHGTETDSRSPKVAVITGASAGIGAAAAHALAREGFRLVLGARRRERLEALAAEIQAEAGAAAVERAEFLDVTDSESIEAFCDGVPRAHLLVNNAGAALGLDSIEGAVERRWRDMWELNVLGVLRMTRALLPKLVASGDGHVVNLGSTAGFETYPGGAGYTASKHALRALTRTLRLELLGRPVRVTEVSPGLVETEFSLVRFDGDAEKAKSVYRGMQPLTAQDVAECIAWVATRPSHVNVDEVVLRPRDQAHSTLVHRREEG